MGQRPRANVFWRGAAGRFDRANRDPQGIRPAAPARWENRRKGKPRLLRSVRQREVTRPRAEAGELSSEVLSLSTNEGDRLSHSFRRVSPIGNARARRPVIESATEAKGVR
jgi:hypothetical protein